MRCRCCGLAAVQREPARRRSRACFVALGLVFFSSWPLFPAAALSGRGLPEADVIAVPGSADAAGKGRLLVASRQLQDPNFMQTVVLVLESGPSGVIGVVVNRPSQLELRAVLPEVKGLDDRRDTVFLGGPVERFQLLLLVRSSAPPKDSMRVFQDVFVTASLDALHRAAEERGQNARFRLFAGYAGWGAGQLEREVARGDWLIVPGDVDRVFASAPERIWSELVELNSGRWVRFDTPGWRETGESHCGAGGGTPTMAAPCESARPRSCSR